MLIHLARLLDPPHTDGPVRAFTSLAAQDKVGVHEITESAELADAILFTQCHMLPTDWRLATIRDHPLTRQYRDKVMVYDERDRPWCAFPGVYVSMPRRLISQPYQRAWGYFTVPRTSAEGEPDLLFSFVASDSAGCRRPLFALKHSNAIVEKARRFTFYDQTSPNYGAQRARFQSILGRSRFVLCPRGRGTSSIRLYETLAAGRVPVIIADDWTPPLGPDWEAFSIRWPENQTRGLVTMLEERDHDWPQMSAEARRAYDRYFSAEVSFHNIAGLCDDLLRSGPVSAFPSRGIRDRAYVYAGMDVARWRSTSAIRRVGKRGLSGWEKLAHRRSA